MNFRFLAIFSPKRLISLRKPRFLTFFLIKTVEIVQNPVKNPQKTRKNEQKSKKKLKKKCIKTTPKTLHIGTKNH